MLESKFKSETLNEIRDLFPGCIILANDANYLPGVPDILVLYKNRYAALEFKQHETAKQRPNQDYYVDLLDRWSFSAFIYPENKKEVLHDLQQSFKSAGVSRVSKR